MTMAGPRGRAIVLVTGAAGCVGALLVEELLGEGYDVVATDRPGATLPPPRPGLRSVAVDLTRPESLPSLVVGVDAVIHTAAWVDIAVPYAAQAPINLHAVRRLYHAAREAGVAHFVHFSSGSIYASKDGPLREDDPLVPSSGYEQTKLLAEDFLRAQAPGGPTVTVLRPALIYGPRGRVLVAPLATIPPLLGWAGGLLPGIEGGPRTNLVHGLDCARAATHLLGLGPVGAGIFNVASPDVLSAGELLGTVLRVGGLPSPGLRLPFPGRLVGGLLPLLRYEAPFALFNRGAGALWSRRVLADGLEPALAPRVDPEATAYLSGDTVFDASRLAATGFTYRYPTFEGGWRDTVAWYRAARWLPEGPARRGVVSDTRSGQGPARKAA